MSNTSPGKKIYLTRQNMLRPSQLSAFYPGNSSDFYMCNSMYFVQEIKCLAILYIIISISVLCNIHFCQTVEAFSVHSYRELYELLEAFHYFQQANTSITRHISVLSCRKIHQILEAFSELGNNIGRNLAIVFVLDRQQYGLQQVFFLQKVTCSFLLAG